MKDNRNYVYPPQSTSKRPEYTIIVAWIPPGANVLDLACGDGTLLRLLEDKGVKVEGIDTSESAVTVCKNKGLKVKQGRIDVKLPYRGKTFDYAICNATLQMVMYPEVLISEMVRVAKYQIISFPNFAFFPNRLEMLFNGRMPQRMLFGYKWYSTGHIHQLSITDFEELCKSLKIKIRKRHHIIDAPIKFVPRQILGLFPNLFASVSIYLSEGTI